MDRFMACFGEVEDPRALNRRHDFLEVVFVALAAMLCGAEDCTDMAAFARACMLGDAGPRFDVELCRNVKRERGQENKVHAIGL